MQRLPQGFGQPSRTYQGSSLEELDDSYTIPHVNGNNLAAPFQKAKNLNNGNRYDPVTLFLRQPLTESNGNGRSDSSMTSEYTMFEGLDDCGYNDASTSFQPGYSTEPNNNENFNPNINMSRHSGYKSNMTPMQMPNYSYHPQPPNSFPHAITSKLNNNLTSGARGFVRKALKVLVIGATGAGKTSLINLFYVWGQNWTAEEVVRGHKKVLIKTEFLDGDGDAEANVKNQGESQTTKAKHYTFDLHDEERNILYELNFLDTPGIGDTSGIEKDDMHFDVIMDTVSKTQGLNAILLVLNGADGRINARVRYLMVRLQSMIPDALRENLVVLLTNTDLEPNLDINQTVDFRIDEAKIFYYNNQIFRVKPEKLNNHNVKNRYEDSFKNSKETLANLLDVIAGCSIKPTEAFGRIKDARDNLKKALVDCNDMDAKIYAKKQELQQLAQSVASGNMAVDDLQKRLNKQVTKEDFGDEHTPYHNTICLSCKNTCHEQCGLQETTSQGDEIFRGCWAMGGNGQCNQCTHSYTSHVHLRKKYVKQTVQETMVDSNIQSQLQQAQYSVNSVAQTHAIVTSEIQRLDQQLDNNHQRIKKIIMDMKQYCSRFDYIKEIDATIHVLEEQIDAATSDYSVSGSQADANKISALNQTKDKMVRLRAGLVQHLKSLN